MLPDIACIRIAHSILYRYGSNSTLYAFAFILFVPAPIAYFVYAIAHYMLPGIACILKLLTNGAFTTQETTCIHIVYIFSVYTCMYTTCIHFPHTCIHFLQNCIYSSFGLNDFFRCFKFDSVTHRFFPMFWHQRRISMNVANDVSAVHPTTMTKEAVTKSFEEHAWWRKAPTQVSGNKKSAALNGPA